MWSSAVQSFTMIQAAIFHKTGDCCAHSFRTAAVSMAMSRWVCFLSSQVTTANVSTPRFLVIFVDHFSRYDRIIFNQDSFISFIIFDDLLSSMPSFVWLGGRVVRMLDQQVTSSKPGLPVVKCSPGQVVNTHVPLSPSIIIWYQPTGGDALWLGR